MKQLSLFILLSLFCQPIFGQELTFQPSHPLPGETITITYQQDSTARTKEEGIQMVAYLFEEDKFNKILPKALDWTKEKDTYIANFSTTLKSTGLLIKVLPENADFRDITETEGYGIMFYENDRKKTKQQALVAKAAMHIYYSSGKGIRRLPIISDSLLLKEFEQYPTSKTNPFVYKVYLFHKLWMDKKIGTLLIKDWATDIDLNPNPSEEELTECYDIFRYILTNKANAHLRENLEKMMKRGAILYPNSQFKSLLIKDKLYAETSWRKQFSYLKKLEFYQKKGADNQAIIDDCLRKTAINTTALKGKFKQSERALSKMKSRFLAAQTYTQIAQICAGKTVEDKGYYLKKASIFAEKAVSILEKEQNNSNPQFWTKKWYEQVLSTILKSAKEAHALLLFKMGEEGKALQIQEKICSNNQFNSLTSVQRYTKYLEAVEGGDKAYTTLRSIILNGKSNTEMERQFKQLCLAKGYNQEAFEQEIKTIKEAGNLKFALALSADMKEKKAPLFNLKNFAGETISLESLRGKVVVLDFWATWCGPCKASFPAMRKLVNQYAEQEDVVFLFVDVSAKSGGEIAESMEYILDSNYPFEVIVDTENKVAEAYNIRSIPTKIVIDPKGNIRFISNGFNNDDEYQIKEMTMMIELASQ